MPKISPYPKFSLQKIIPIIEVLKQNNQTLSLKDAAALLGQSKSGHFMNIISSAVKFALLKNKKGCLTLTELGASLLDNHNHLRQDVLKRVLVQPKGFASLLKLWKKKEQVNIGIIGQYLDLSSSESQKLQKVLKDSFSLLNSIEEKTHYVKGVSEKKRSHNDKNHFFVQVKSEKLYIEQSIQNKEQLQAFIKILKTNF